MSDFYRDLEKARKECRPKERDFALNLATGLSEEAAFCAVYGEKHRKNRYYIKKRCAELMAGCAGRYYGLLMSPMNERVISDYALKRSERLSLLSMGAVLAYRMAQEQDDPKAINPMVRCVNELNRMSGDHAPDQVEVNGRILHAAINANMTNEQATELYKQAMRGARLGAIEHDTKDSTERLIEYEPIVNNKN